MSENSDALKRGYDAFNKGDIDTVMALFADDIRWEGPNTEGVPMAGVHEGKDAMKQAIGQIGESFEEFRAIPDEMVEEGDTIVVLSHVEGKTKSGNDVKVPGVEIWRMRSGTAKRVQSLTETAEVKEALAG
jgi:uncharacterized protein